MRSFGLKKRLQRSSHQYIALLIDLIKPMAALVCSQTTVARREVKALLVVVVCKLACCVVLDEVLGFGPY